MNLSGGVAGRAVGKGRRDVLDAGHLVASVDALIVHIKGGPKAEKKKN
jgi:hypothetical protein